MFPLNSSSMSLPSPNVNKLDSEKLNGGEIALLVLIPLLLFFWTLSSVVVLCGPFFGFVLRPRRKVRDVSVVEGDGEGGKTSAEDIPDARPEKRRYRYK
jgi:hypothetical protein